MAAISTAATPTTALMTGVSPREMHGHLLESRAAELCAPRVVTHCAKEARPGYAYTVAHEYLDDEETLKQKVKIVAELLRRAHKPLLYTGAGISTASGIADYASEVAGEKSIVAHLKRPRASPWAAQPTLAHRILAKVHECDDLRQFVWVQQNHDGLPQKAGFPQEWINEIHGSIYDPSNPVVPMTGTLRGDLCAWMEELEQTSDLSIVLGTSLCGMNADRLVSTVAEKSLNDGQDGALGAVIVSLQRTQLDYLSSVRVFATIDSFAAALAEELGIEPSAYEPQVPPVYTIRQNFADCADAESKQPSGRNISTAGSTTSLADKNTSAASVDIPEGSEIFRIPYDATTGKIAAVARDNGESVPFGWKKSTDEHSGKDYYYHVDGRTQWARPEATAKCMSTLDLREGSTVRLTMGPHAGDLGEVQGRDRHGHFTITFQHKLKKTSKLTRPFQRKLGAWWVEAALEGRVTQMPIVTVM